MRRWLIPGAACALAALAAAHGADLVLANEALEVRLDGASGSVLQVTDRAHALDLVVQPGLAPPFRLHASTGDLAVAGDVSATRDLAFDGTAYDLAWPTADGAVTVHARLALARGAAPLRAGAQAVNAGGARLEWIEYPVVAGIGSLGGDPARTDLVVPFATGYRITDPLQHLAAGVRFGAYPDAYGGAALQQLALLQRDTGGFHVQVEDGSGGAKWLDVWRDGTTGRLELTVRRYNADARAGLGLAPPGETVVFASATGTWEEGADRYRAWALTQPWAAAGPRRDWPEAARARWLTEEAGAATFGISVRRDQTAWFGGLADFLAVPLFHVSGFWWPGGTFASEWYGGYNDWSDDRVLPANLDRIHAKGDHVALFLFPQHFSRDATEYAHASPSPGSDPVAPWSPYAMSPDPESAPWSSICPATATWPAFYGWRAVTLMQHHLADAEYLDIGPGLGRVHCENAAHGHVPGWGPPVEDGVRAMLDSRRGELHALRGRFVPRGTELMSELWLDRFDFYQARAAAGPLAMLEGDTFRAGVKAGWAQKIPLLDFVYHDYGPVRLDGNLKLSTQVGALFYRVAARVVLDGGLPELNYELSALERLPGMTGATYFETYRAAYDCRDTTPYAADATKAAFLRELADLRTRRGPEFLAHGRMRRGPLLAAAPADVTLDWRLYNTFNRAFTCDNGTEQGPEFFETGTATGPALETGAFSAPEGAVAGTSPRAPVERVGLFVAEVGGAARTASLVLDPARQGVTLLNFRATVRRRTQDDDLGVLQAGAVRNVALAAREAVLVRLAAAPCTAATCRYRVYRAPAPGALDDDAALRAEATGHAYADDALHDGRTWFYLVDDGGGYPGDTLRVTRSATIDLAW